MFLIIRTSHETFPTAAEAFKAMRLAGNATSVMVVEAKQVQEPVPDRPSVVLGDRIVVTYENRKYVAKSVSYKNLRELFTSLTNIPNDKNIRELIELPALSEKWELQYGR